MTLWPYTLAHARRFGVTENSQPVHWKTFLAYITGSVDQELLLRNEYPGDGKPHPPEPDHGAPPVERRRAQGAGGHRPEAGEAGPQGSGEDCQARHDSRLAPHPGRPEV